ncbi:MAG: aminodeoxychorismate synthase component I [Raineya sp.]|nr:aminodeoxychorismate synthase component I [Raineya sp.]
MKFLWNIDADFENALLNWANTFPYCIFLNPHHWQDEYPFGSFPKVLAVASSKKEYDFLSLQTPQNQWIFGYLGYDLKNKIENLSSHNPDYLGFEEGLCFEPEYLFIWLNDNELQVEVNHPFQEDIFRSEISKSADLQKNKSSQISIEAQVTYEEYCQNVEKIKNHILEGDIYELNYCTEFFAENIEISPIRVYKALCKRSPMPFSVFLKTQEKYALCASPERFLKKQGQTLISQPIKGTIPRGETPTKDLLQKEKLRYSEKEMAENMMIVDLVRNDLARSAIVGTTKVTEMFGIYTFKQLHQMISTVEAQINPSCTISDVIKNAFPMGSMTGAPKIKAMELIEHYENTKRGLFSGAIGFINPLGDFDFNVVIRTIFYDAKKHYLSFQVGSAITYDSLSEQEYEECMLKAKAIREVLNSL